MYVYLLFKIARRNGCLKNVTTTQATLSVYLSLIPFSFLLASLRHPLRHPRCCRHRCCCFLLCPSQHRCWSHEPRLSECGWLLWVVEPLTATVLVLIWRKFHRLGWLPVNAIIVALADVRVDCQEESCWSGCSFGLGCGSGCGLGCGLGCGSGCGCRCCLCHWDGFALKFSCLKFLDGLVARIFPDSLAWQILVLWRWPRAWTVFRWNVELTGSPGLGLLRAVCVWPSCSVA